MSTEVKTNIDKIVSLIKEECQKENIDTSSFILSGEYSNYVMGNPSSSEVRKVFPIVITNKETLNPQNTDKYVKLAPVQNKIMDENYDTLNCEINLIPEMKAGIDNLPIKSNKFDNDEEVVLLLENGVSVIDFWAEWCGPCVSAMNHNFEMIERNFDKWNGKVKFFTTCRTKAEEKEDKLKFIQDRNWNRFPEVIQHYHRSTENPASNIYGVQYIPFIVIVDQKGILRHVGSIGDLNIEQFVNELLEGKDSFQTSQTTAETESATQIDSEFVNRFEAFKVEFVKLYKEVKSDEVRKANYNMGFRMNSVSKFNYNMQKLVVEDFQTTEVKFTLKCRKNEFDTFNSFLYKHFSEDEIKKYELKLELLETFNVEIPENDHCSSCQAKIGREDLTYHCPECKIFFCASCVNARKDKSGFEALVHKEHYLLVFKNPKPENLLNLDKPRLGKNLFSQMKEDELSREHGYCCNGGNGCEDLSERFICMNCRPGLLWNGGHHDYCRTCFDKICTSDIEVESSDGHRGDHVYLHMIYKGNSYYEY